MACSTRTRFDASTELKNFSTLVSSRSRGRRELDALDVVLEALEPRIGERLEVWVVEMLTEVRVAERGEVVGGASDVQ